MDSNLSQLTLLPEVFIVETLDYDDEISNRYEGQVLTDILRLAGKSPRYYYFQTTDELEPLAKLFEASQYRYLHVSAHGTEAEISVGGIQILYDEFLSPFRKALARKRLFCSSCLLGNGNFIEAVEKANHSAMSVAAPCDTVGFDVSAAFWAAFYISCFEDAYDGLPNYLIADKLLNLCTVFDLDFCFASRDFTQNQLMMEILFSKNADRAYSPPASAWAHLLAKGNC